MYNIYKVYNTYTDGDDTEYETDHLLVSARNEDEAKGIAKASTGDGFDKVVMVGWKTGEMVSEVY